MKMMLALLLFAFSLSAVAHEGGGRDCGHYNGSYRGAYHGGYRNEWRYNPGYGWGWSIPVLVGGVIVGYELSQEQQQPVIVQQPAPVIVQQQPTVVQQSESTMKNCSPWTETQTPDGKITRSRTCDQ